MFTMRNRTYLGKVDESQLIADFLSLDGDECSIESSENGAVFHISSYSEDGSFQLDRDAAVKFAQKILEMADAEGA
jgi:hypothetical protein